MHIVASLGKLWQVCCGVSWWDVGILGIGGGGVAMQQCSWDSDMFGVVMWVVDVIGVLVLRRCACWWSVGGVLGVLVFS
jgi:hypothetical protein